jgi:arylsulfatase A-like enzyme/Tfp pilus assembly protein PilF
MNSKLVGKGYGRLSPESISLRYYFYVFLPGRFKILNAAGLSAIFVGLIASACGNPTNQLPQAADQNVLLITVDTLRADALGCDGGPARTPNIDALAAAGVRFSFAHAQAVVTLPSHASILTGTYPFQHGYRQNSGYRLTPGVQTLATRLKASGFQTGAFVGAFPLDARFGLTPGFDVYDGRFDNVGTGGEFLLPERPATVVVSRATEWIRGTSAKWFAWVHVYEPHAPYRPPPPFDREYASQPYYGEVAEVDRALAPLLDLVRNGSANGRPTLVILTGDHGEALGEHGETTHGLFAYEATLRIPLIMANTGGPSGSGGSRRSGEVSDQPVRHVDIVPTILDALALPVPAELPGHSLRTRADRDGGATRASYFEAMESMIDFGFAPLDGVLVGRDKYIHLPLPELYNLAADRAEATNLIDRSAERARVLSARLTDFHAAVPGAPQAEAPEVAARLQSLGYVSGSAAPKTHYTERDDPKQLVAIDRRMKEAVALDEEGSLPGAIRLYGEILKDRPDMMAASRHLAFDQWRAGAVPAAVDTLRAALRAGPATPGAQIQLGTYLMESGRAAEAIELLRVAAAAEPSLDAWNALGIAYARGGRATDALATFDRSLAIDPGNAMTFENIGTVHLEAGRLADAKRAFEHATASNPDSSQAHAGLAVVALKSGDRQTAIAQWTRSVDLQPSNFDAVYTLGMQLAQAGQMDAARHYLTQFVQHAPRGQYGPDIDRVSALLARLKP